MSVTIAKWTLDEYHRMIEVGILDDRQVGQIVEMPSATTTASPDFRRVLRSDK